MGKLVLADVDGTILRYGKETTTRRVAEAVVRMQEQGHALVPVTSRSARLMGRLALQLRLRHLGVLDGGATVYDFATDSRDATLSCWLEPHKTAAIIKAIGRYCSEVYYGEDSSRFGERATIDRNSPSVFAVYPNEVGADVSRALEAISGISLYANQYENSETHSCLQIVREGVSKRSGAQLLLAGSRYSYFAPEDIIAIGDGDPDRDLLLATPEGARRIAVGNNPRLLEVANAIVPPASEDGFAIAMERFVLH